MFKSADIQSGLLLWAKTQIIPRHPSQRYHGSSFVIFPALGYAREASFYILTPGPSSTNTSVCLSRLGEYQSGSQRNRFRLKNTCNSKAPTDEFHFQHYQQREGHTALKHARGFPMKASGFQFLGKQSKYLSRQWSRHQWKASSYWEPTIIYFFKSGEDGKLLATGYNAGTGPYGQK